MKRYQLCCDMDGVLCDFASGALKIVNQTLAEKDKYKNTNPELYDTITKALNEIDIQFKNSYVITTKLISIDGSNYLSEIVFLLNNEKQNYTLKFNRRNFE